jgi:hypothetical protein
MPTTAVHYSRQSQLPLATDKGESIVPRPMSKCPHCHKRCVIIVRRSIPTIDSILRDRICTGCGFGFSTTMGLLDHCDACGNFDSFECKRSERLLNGVFRIYRCKCCGHRAKTMETFPVLGQEQRLKEVGILLERERNSYT